MSALKLGQRVRVVNPEPMWPSLRGKTGTITRVGPPEFPVGKPYEYAAQIDGGNAFNFFAWELAPLTDPLADQFIERLKKLANEPRFVVEAVWDYESVSKIPAQEGQHQ